MQSVTLCRIPRAGMGNQLLTWAKAATYSHRHGLELIHWGWSNPSLTRIRRIRMGNETWLSLLQGTPLLHVAKRLHQTRGWARIVEPAQDAKPLPEKSVCLFHSVPPWQDYFGDFRDERDFVLAELRKTMRAGVWEQAKAIERPYVIANVRMDDFKTLAGGVEFASVGQHRTPFEFFESAATGIRHHAGWNVPIHVVTDGTPEELAPLMARVANIVLVPQRPALVNLLWMSQANAIIASAGSTFSFWAGFLGQAAMMHHPSHVPVPSRPLKTTAQCYDGPAVEHWNEWPDLLKSNLRAIQTR